MKNRILQSLIGLFAFAATAAAQTSTTGFAPANFGNVVLTSTPSNATGPSGVSTVFTSSGTELTLGSGGALVNPALYNYTVTGPNTATFTVPASGSTPASTTNLVFTSRTTGTYTTTGASGTTTGQFNLATIPSAAPIANVSARALVPDGGSSTVGFVIAGTMPRRVLIRAVGPTLANFGVTDALPNPSLALYNGLQLIARNDQWGTMASTTTTGSTSTGSTSTGGTSTGGTSTGGTSTGGMSTGGTSTGGTSTTTTSGVLTGTLGATGSAYSVQLATAENFTGTGAFALQSGSNDAALVAMLPPGAYTVVVSSSATTGGTSTGGTSTGGTSTGGTSTGGTSTDTTSTGGTSTGGTSTGGTSTGGTSTGGTSTGTTSTGTSTSTAATGGTSGETLVEVYFIE